MLFAINRGRVEHYQDGQRPIIHLVSTVEVAISLGLPWAFTNMHAELGYAEYFDDWSQNSEIDWPSVRANYWAGDERKKKKQAEFLVHRQFPCKNFTEIGVLDKEIKKITDGILAKSGHNVPVAVRSAWYY